MRYILSDEGYIETVSFNNEVTCNNKTCTEYTGTVPEGYSSLAEWSEKAVIQAYKITDGNLTHDPDKETDLLSEWEEQTGQKVLWKGDFLMKGDQSVTLKEKISSQPNGIVLIFSPYENNSVQDFNFVTHFVPKKQISMYGGKGMCFPLITNTFYNLGCKYLYIHDDKIYGNDNNSSTGTGSSGISYKNNYWVLRYVIGV